MKIDPQARRVTSLFMVLALVVMAALAWSVSRDKDPAATPQGPTKNAAPAAAGAAL